MAPAAIVASHRYLLIVAIGYLAGIAAYSRLPGPDPFRGPYSLYSVASLPFTAFLLPTTAALIYALVRSVWARDPVRDGEETFEPTYEAILFAVGVFIIAVHLMVVALLTDALPAQRAWFLRATIVLLGVVVVRVGNLLPRTRPNLAIGIRTSRTLTNRRLWMQTHRMAGYVAVGLGAAFVVSGAFLSRPTIELVMGFAVPTAIALVVVSHYKYCAH
jgi:uncharacterized membrane protein